MGEAWRIELLVVLLPVLVTCLSPSLAALRSAEPPDAASCM